MSRTRPLPAAALLALAAAACAVVPPVLAQAARSAGAALPVQPPIPPALPSAEAASRSAAARYVESCQQAAEQGSPNPAGCVALPQGAELTQLRSEALRSQNPALLMLLGDAYAAKPQAGAGADAGQAYRWYLMAAVRGDARAMQRLAELHHSGSGVPQDSVRALGYARLAERLALPGTAAARQAQQSASSIGRGMAEADLAQADQFAAELEQQIRQQRGGGPAAEAGAGSVPGLNSAAGAAPAPPPANVPGLGQATRAAQP